MSLQWSLLVQLVDRNIILYKIVCSGDKVNINLICINDMIECIQRWESCDLSKMAHSDLFKSLKIRTCPNHVFLHKSSTVGKLKTCNYNYFSFRCAFFWQQLLSHIKYNDFIGENKFISLCLHMWLQYKNNKHLFLIKTRNKHSSLQNSFQVCEENEENISLIYNLSLMSYKQCG